MKLVAKFVSTLSLALIALAATAANNGALIGKYYQAQDNSHTGNECQVVMQMSSNGAMGLMLSKQGFSGFARTLVPVLQMSYDASEVNAAFANAKKMGLIKCPFSSAGEKSILLQFQPDSNTARAVDQAIAVALCVNPQTLKPSAVHAKVGEWKMFIGFTNQYQARATMDQESAIGINCSDLK